MFKTDIEQQNCNMVLRAMPFGQRITREALRMVTGLSDRTLRGAIELLRKDGEFIINEQTGGGYVRIDKDNMTREDERAVLRQIAQEKSRAKRIMDNIAPMMIWAHSSTELFREV